MHAGTCSSLPTSAPPPLPDLGLLGVGCGVWGQEEFLCLGACYCVTTRLQIAEGMEAERCGSQGAGQLDLGQDLPMVQSRFCGV